MARIGIVGYPNVGKTTLFNALTGLDALTAAHPFSTAEPNVGIAVVPDHSLDRAAELEGSKKQVNATLDLLDLPAMTGPDQGGGIGAAYVARLREMEALAVVLRAFTDESVPPDPEGGTDPLGQAENLALELAVADSEVFSRRRDKIAKEATADPAKKAAANAIASAAEVLEAGRQLRAEPWSPAELAAFRDLAPLTLKPIVWVINVGEDETDAAELVAAVEAAVPGGDAVVALSAGIEEEGARLDAEERAELFAGLGLGEGALAVMVRASYKALGLLSFYTLGPKEAHAWTIRRGATARDAAGKVHSDLERGFIRAEIATIEDVIESGGWDPAKAAGLTRVEGRDYVLVDGEVMLVRFSV